MAFILLSSQLSNTTYNWHWRLSDTTKRTMNSAFAMVASPYATIRNVSNSLALFMDMSRYRALTMSTNFAVAIKQSY